jgi:DNA polymerase IIIc chi subunit
MYEKKAEDGKLEIKGITAQATPVKASIKGYRQLSDAEQALINRVKATAEEVAHLVTDVRDFVESNPLEHDDVTRLNPARWAALADTDFQVGFMKLVRSIARPTNY